MYLFLVVWNFWWSAVVILSGLGFYLGVNDIDRFLYMFRVMCVLYFAWFFLILWTLFYVSWIWSYLSCLYSYFCFVLDFAFSFFEGSMVVRRYSFLFVALDISLKIQILKANIFAEAVPFSCPFIGLDWWRLWFSSLFFLFAYWNLFLFILFLFVCLFILFVCCFDLFICIGW